MILASKFYNSVLYLIHTYTWEQSLAMACNTVHICNNYTYMHSTNKIDWCNT